MLRIGWKEFLWCLYCWWWSRDTHPKKFADGRMLIWMIEFDETVISSLQLLFPMTYSKVPTFDIERCSFLRLAGVWYGVPGGATTQTLWDSDSARIILGHWKVGAALGCKKGWYSERILLMQSLQKSSQTELMSGLQLKVTSCLRWSLSAFLVDFLLVDFWECGSQSLPKAVSPK